MNINENFLKLQDNYLFSIIAKKVKAFEESNPSKKIIRMGIGDVTKPIAEEVIKNMHKAVDDMGDISTFKGYPPEQGYKFLKEKIIQNDYRKRNIDISEDEIFISDGAKSDTGNIVDIFGLDNIVAITNPVYPVYMDSNIMAGRKDKIIYIPMNEENKFVPELPQKKVDIIYLCFPNNPTGTTITKTELKKWIDYALENKSIILYDAAYEAYISEKNIAHSVYEIEGAKKVAIEFKSFSKTAGFTGIRCGYTVVPKELVGYTKKKEKVILNQLWSRRQSTKFNGVSYISQKAAEAVYSEEGQKQINENIKYYMHNAKIIREGLINIGYSVYGGINAPYIWMKTPKELNSWEFFEYLLNEKGIVGTPGSGFGTSGEGYFRLSAFGNRDDIVEGISRLNV